MKFIHLVAEAQDLLSEGLTNMLIGLTVVFAVLILLSLIIWAFKLIGKIGGGSETPAEKAPAAPASAPAPAPAAAKGPGTMAESDLNIEGSIDGDTAAVILGAVAQECGGNFKVTSIKKM